MINIIATTSFICTFILTFLIFFKCKTLRGLNDEIAILRCMLQMKSDKCDGEFEKLKSEIILMKYYGGLSRDEVLAKYGFISEYHYTPGYRVILPQILEPRNIDGIKFATFKLASSSVIDNRKWIELNPDTNNKKN